MSVCDVPVISTVCDTVGEGAATLVSAPFEWLAQAMGAAAAWMFEGVWQVLDTTTLVDVTNGSYVRVYNIVFGIAIVLMLLFFCLQLLTGMIRRDPSALQRAGLGLARSVLGSFLIITLTAAALEITDQLCIGIVQATGTTMEEMGGRIAALGAGLVAISIAAPGAGAVITTFLAGMAIAAAAILWFSLLIRKALLLVSIVLAPIALAGHSWDATRTWFSKWAAFVLALIVSKLVVVVIFLVAVTQISAPIDFDLASIADPIAGIVLMLIAGFAPYMCYKLIAFIGTDIYHSMSTESEAKNAVNRPVPVPTSPRPRQTSGAEQHGRGVSPSGGDGSGAGRTGPAGGSRGAGGSPGGPGGAAAGAGNAAGAAAAGRRVGTSVGAAAEKDAAAAQDTTTTKAPPTRSTRTGSAPSKAAERGDSNAQAGPAPSAARPSSGQDSSKPRRSSTVTEPAAPFPPDRSSQPSPHPSSPPPPRTAPAPRRPDDSQSES